MGRPPVVEEDMKDTRSIRGDRRKIIRLTNYGQVVRTSHSR